LLASWLEILLEGCLYWECLEEWRQMLLDEWL